MAKLPSGSSGSVLAALIQRSSVRLCLGPSCLESEAPFMQHFKLPLRSVPRKSVSSFQPAFIINSLGIAGHVTYVYCAYVQC